jgi:peptidoglycan hydrolase-like protein with peptidoglycan-binding domain
MKKRKYLALASVLVVGLALHAAPAKAGSTPAKKKSASLSGSKSRRIKSSRRSGRQRGQKAPDPQRITQIQQALAKDGSFAGAPNGKWDASTVDGMKKFQAAHGLNPSGKLDAKTLQQLGLGSQTAGIAPPLPPISSTAATITPMQSVRRRQ